MDINNEAQVEAVRRGKSILRQYKESLEELVLHGNKAALAMSLQSRPSCSEFMAALDRASQVIQSIYNKRRTRA